jgi:glutathione S-transferase
MLRLYDFPMSPRVRKVRIVLAEKGLEYEKVHIDIFKGEQKQPEYLAINPYGKVPALQDNGVTLYESTVIMEYLNDKYPDPPLLPTDPGQRARARVLVHHGDNPYESAVATLVGELVIKPTQGGATDQAVVAKAKENLSSCFARLEMELGHNEYLLGSAFSLSDIPFIAWGVLFPNLKVATPPRLEAWFSRLAARPGVKAAG